MPRKQKRYHYIYKTTNLIKGYYYIGMHSTDDLFDGYFGSGKRLQYSLSKYGRENHNVEILEMLSNRVLLAEREKQIVNEELLKNPLCINLKIGGEGGGTFGVTHTECTKQKMSKAHTSKTFSDTHKEKISISNKGKKLSEDCKMKLSKSHSGKKLSEEIKKKISDAVSGENHPLFGKRHSNESKRKCSETKKEQLKSNEARQKLADARRGILHSEDTKKRMSESKKGNQNRAVRIIIDDVPYESIKLAAEVLGKSPNWVRSRVVSDKFENFKYE